MKTICILLAVALAFTVVALVPGAEAACATNTDPVVSYKACTDGSCHVDVLQGLVVKDCP